MKRTARARSSVTAGASTRSPARSGTPRGRVARARLARSAGPASPGRAGTRCPSPAAAPGASPEPGRRLRAGQEAPGRPRAGMPAPGRRQAAGGGADDGQLAERTADLQRLQAEYANYRKRVERDRLAVREQALANVLTELLPVLDDIGRAREHGELAGGFKSVAESLEAAAVKLGLTSYGEDGDPFDPKLHEALMHSYSPDVTEPTCVQHPAARLQGRRPDPAPGAGRGRRAGRADEPAEPGDAPGRPPRRRRRRRRREQCRASSIATTRTRRGEAR